MTTYPHWHTDAVSRTTVHRLPSPRAPADLQSQVRWKSTDAVVVEVTGEIDACTCAKLEATLEEHLRARPAALRVDLGEVSFLGTAGLRVLHRIRARAAERGVHLIVDPGRSRIAARALALLPA